MKELATIATVLPSGVAREAASVPMTEAAPGRFSMRVETACACPHFSASTRVSKSAPPPAGNGTINRICRDDCAPAVETDNAAVKAADTIRILPMNFIAAFLRAAAGAAREDNLTA